MTTEIWGIFVATVLALMSTPGPSHLLMLSNAMAHGFGRSVSTAAGDLCANLLQMLAAGLGLVVLLAGSADALAVVKWLGVGYLLWLGLRGIARAGSGAGPGRSAGGRTRLRRLWMQGFLTSAANPKAVVFFAALFPQFISPDAPFWPQFLILAATYVVLDGLFLSAYGLTASWVARRFRGWARAWVERAGGGFMIVAAVLLGLRTATQR